MCLSLKCYLLNTLIFKAFYRNVVAFFFRWSSSLKSGHMYSLYRYIGNQFLSCLVEYYVKKYNKEYSLRSGDTRMTKKKTLKAVFKVKIYFNILFTFLFS